MIKGLGLQARYGSSVSEKDWIFDVTGYVILSTEIHLGSPEFDSLILKSTAED